MNETLSDQVTQMKKKYYEQCQVLGDLYYSSVVGNRQTQEKMNALIQEMVTLNNQAGTLLQFKDKEPEVLPAEEGNS